MSLYGRYLIDRMKRLISPRFILPVPPYGSPTYWDKVYSKLGVNDVYEWGDLDFRYDLKVLKYKDVERKEHLNSIRNVFGDYLVADDSMKKNPVTEQNFDEAIGVHGNSGKETILLLGCGNSRLGEDILQYYVDKQHSQNLTSVPKIVQCDVSTSLVKMLTDRYQSLILSKQMIVAQDDATKLDLVEDDSIDTILDKGLMDALFCSNQDSQMKSIMKSVNRVLKVGKVFLFFSYSRPAFLLQDIKDENTNGKIWSQIDVRELERIYIYKFTKGKAKVVKDGYYAHKRVLNQKRWHRRKVK